MKDLLEQLAAPPRMQGRILDVRGLAATLPQEWAWWADRVTLRFFTGDPYEADRDGPDRFLANHLLEEPEVILYLSWGEAELDAADMGWDAYLARALSTAVGAAVDHDDVCRRGMYTAEKVALGRSDAAAQWREPIDATLRWKTAEWVPYFLGVFVDIVEAAYGLIGFSQEPLEFDEPGEGDPECPACNGRPVFVPHSPAALLRTLCGEHKQEWDERSADRVPPHEGEAKRALGIAMLGAAQPQAPAGFWAGLTRIDSDSGSLQYAFLQRVAGWCAEHDVDLDDVAYVDDAMTDAMPRGLEPVARDLGVEAALEAADFRRAILPSACWVADLGAMTILGEAGRDDEAAAIRELLATHGREWPFVYHAIGESLNSRAKPSRHSGGIARRWRAASPSTSSGGSSCPSTACVAWPPRRSRVRRRRIGSSRWIRPSRPEVSLRCALGATSRASAAAVASGNSAADSSELSGVGAGAQLGAYGDDG